MSQDRWDTYKIAREAKGLTQEATAGELGISDGFIRAYETGRCIPPPEVMDLIVTAYDSQLPGIQYLRASTDMAQSIVPGIREVWLPGAIIELLDRIYGFVDIHQSQELLRIDKDGITDGQERPIFDTIVTELGGLVEVAMAVRYTKQEHLEEGVE